MSCRRTIPTYSGVERNGRYRLLTIRPVNVCLVKLLVIKEARSRSSALAFRSSEQQATWSISRIVHLKFRHRHVQRSGRSCSDPSIASVYPSMLSRHITQQTRKLALAASSRVPARTGQSIEISIRGKDDRNTDSSSLSFLQRCSPVRSAEYGQCLKPPSPTSRMTSNPFPGLSRKSLRQRACSNLKFSKPRRWPTTVPTTLSTHSNDV